jgi:hypothetical protein
MILSLILTAALSLPAQACAEHAQAAKAKDTVRAVASAPAGEKSYGKGVTLKQEPISLKEALAKKDELKDKEILLKAKVATVCQASGCWLTLKEGKTEVRVTFANYSFFVPKDSAAKEAVMQGKLFEKEITAAEARHYAQDAKMPKEEIAKITQPVKTPWFEATGLTLSQK